jgi:hypothetical protein
MTKYLIYYFEQLCTIISRVNNYSIIFISATDDLKDLLNFMVKEKSLDRIWNLKIIPTVLERIRTYR